MSIIYFLAYQLIDEMTHINFPLSHYFLLSLVLSIELYCDAIVHIKDFWVIVKLTACLRNEIQIAECFFEVAKLVLSYC